MLIIVAPFYSQLRDLIDALPTLSQELKNQDVVKQVNNDGDFTGSLHSAAEWLAQNLPGITASVFGLAGSIFGAVFTGVTILFMTLFLSMEGNRIGQYAHGYVDPALQKRVLKVASESSRLVASYVAGALAIALIAGTVQFVAMKIAGVPFAAGLAVLVAMLDLIPMIGATIAGAVVVLVSLTVSTETAVAMLLVVIIYQQIENNIVQPLVQKKTISLSPFVIIVAVLIGSTLLGVIGALLALPVTASLKVVAEEFFLDESLLEDVGGDEVAAPSQQHRARWARPRSATSRRSRATASPSSTPTSGARWPPTSCGAWPTSRDRAPRQGLLGVREARHGVRPARRGDLDALDAIYHWTELIQSSPLAVERSVHAAMGGAYRSQRITTLELRFDPMKRNRGGERDLDHIILAAIRGLDRASLEYPQVRAGLIVMMDRTFSMELNRIIVEKAIRWAPRGVVGVDIAGPRPGG